MTRPIASGTLTHLDGESLRPVHLVALDLPDFAARLNDSPRYISYSGDTYSPAGYLLGVGDVTESLDINVESIEVSLSGVDQIYLALLLQQQWRNCPLVVYRGYLNDEETGLVADPLLVWKGRVSQPVINESPPGSGIGESSSDGRSVIVLRAVNIWYDHERSPGRIQSDACQQVFFPGDRGFEFSGAVYNELPWGMRP